MYNQSSSITQSQQPDQTGSMFGQFTKSITSVTAKIQTTAGAVFDISTVPLKGAQVPYFQSTPPLNQYHQQQQPPIIAQQQYQQQYEYQQQYQYQQHLPQQYHHNQSTHYDNNSYSLQNPPLQQHYSSPSSPQQQQHYSSPPTPQQQQHYSSPQQQHYISHQPYSSQYQYQQPNQHQFAQYHNDQHQFAQYHNNQPYSSTQAFTPQQTLTPQTSISQQTPLITTTTLPQQTALTPTSQSQQQQQHDQQTSKEQSQQQQPTSVTVPPSPPSTQLVQSQRQIQPEQKNVFGTLFQSFLPRFVSNPITTILPLRTLQSALYIAMTLLHRHDQYQKSMNLPSLLTQSFDNNLQLLTAIGSIAQKHNVVRYCQWFRSEQWIAKSALVFLQRMLFVAIGTSQSDVHLSQLVAQKSGLNIKISYSSQHPNLKTHDLLQDHLYTIEFKDEIKAKEKMEKKLLQEKLVKEQEEEKGRLNGDKDGNKSNKMTGIDEKDKISDKNECSAKLARKNGNDRGDGDNDDSNKKDKGETNTGEKNDTQGGSFWKKFTSVVTSPFTSDKDNDDTKTNDQGKDKNLGTNNDKDDNNDIKKNIDDKNEKTNDDGKNDQDDSPTQSLYYAPPLPFTIFEDKTTKKFIISIGAFDNVDDILSYLISWPRVYGSEGVIHTGMLLIAQKMLPLILSQLRYLIVEYLYKNNLLKEAILDQINQFQKIENEKEEKLLQKRAKKNKSTPPTTPSSSTTPSITLSKLSLIPAKSTQTRLSIPLIDHLDIDFNEYNGLFPGVIFTGFNVGAGVASILSLLCRDHHHTPLSTPHPALCSHVSEFRQWYPVKPMVQEVINNNTNSIISDIDSNNSHNDNNHDDVKDVGDDDDDVGDDDDKNDTPNNYYSNYQLLCIIQPESIIYSPPAVFSPSLYYKTKSYITSVINNDDIVPRLQEYSLNTFLAELMYETLTREKNTSSLLTNPYDDHTPLYVRQGLHWEKDNIDVDGKNNVNDDDDDDDGTDPFETNKYGFNPKKTLKIELIDDVQGVDDKGGKDQSDSEKVRGCQGKEVDQHDKDISNKGQKNLGNSKSSQQQPHEYAYITPENTQYQQFNRDSTPVHHEPAQKPQNLVGKLLYGGYQLNAAANKVVGFFSSGPSGPTEWLTDLAQQQLLITAKACTKEALGGAGEVVYADTTDRYAQLSKKQFQEHEQTRIVSYQIVDDDKASLQQPSSPRSNNLATPVANNGGYSNNNINSATLVQNNQSLSNSPTHVSPLPSPHGQHITQPQQQPIQSSYDQQQMHQNQYNQYYQQQPVDGYYQQNQQYYSQQQQHYQQEPRPQQQYHQPHPQQQYYQQTQAQSQPKVVQTTTTLIPVDDIVAPLVLSDKGCNDMVNIGTIDDANYSIDPNTSTLTTTKLTIQQSTSNIYDSFTGFIDQHNESFEKILPESIYSKISTFNTARRVGAYITNTSTQDQSMVLSNTQQQKQQSSSSSSDIGQNEKNNTESQQLSIDLLLPSPIHHDVISASVQPYQDNIKNDRIRTNREDVVYQDKEYGIGARKLDEYNNIMISLWVPGNVYYLKRIPSAIYATLFSPTVVSNHYGEGFVTTRATQILQRQDEERKMYEKWQKEQQCGEIYQKQHCENDLIEKKNDLIGKKNEDEGVEMGHDGRKNNINSPTTSCDVDNSTSLVTSLTAPLAQSNTKSLVEAGTNSAMIEIEKNGIDNNNNNNNNNNNVNNKNSKDSKDTTDDTKTTGEYPIWQISPQTWLWSGQNQSINVHQLPQPTPEQLERQKEQYSQSPPTTPRSSSQLMSTAMKHMKFNPLLSLNNGFVFPTTNHKFDGKDNTKDNNNNNNNDDKNATTIDEITISNSLLAANDTPAFPTYINPLEPVQESRHGWLTEHAIQQQVLTRTISPQEQEIADLLALHRTKDTFQASSAVMINLIDTITDTIVSKKKIVQGINLLTMSDFRSQFASLRDSLEVPTTCIGVRREPYEFSSILLSEKMMVDNFVMGYVEAFATALGTCSITTMDSNSIHYQLKADKRAKALRMKQMGLDNDCDQDKNVLGKKIQNFFKSVNFINPQNILLKRDLSEYLLENAQLETQKQAHSQKNITNKNFTQSASVARFLPSPRPPA